MNFFNKVLLSNIFVLYTGFYCLAEQPKLVEHVGLETNSRIINGEPASAGNHSYLVVVIRDYHSNARCGGVLISENFVLTAAQCVLDYSYFVEVVLGAHNLSDSEELGQTRLMINDEDIIVHPEFNPHSLENDLALIKLRKGTDYSEYIQPVKIADPSCETFVGEDVILMGWGKINNYEYADIPMDVKMKVIGQKQCTRFLPELHENQQCAIGSLWPYEIGVGGCSGDTGSPLIIREEEDIVIGIVSVVSESCTDLLTGPTIYTKINCYGDWIEGIINEY